MRGDGGSEEALLLRHIGFRVRGKRSCLGDCRLGVVLGKQPDDPLLLRENVREIKREEEKREERERGEERKRERGEERKRERGEEKDREGTS